MMEGHSVFVQKFKEYVSIVPHLVLLIFPCLKKKGKGRSVSFGRRSTYDTETTWALVSFH